MEFFSPFDVMSLQENFEMKENCDNKKKNMVEKEVKRQDFWVPDTPTKPCLRGKHIEDVAGGSSPIKLFYDELNGSCAVSAESNSFDASLFAYGATNPFPQFNDFEFDPTSSSKKRKKRKNNQIEINDKLPKGYKRKIYRPKVISQLYKRTSKSQVQSNTPKQKRSYVRGAGISSKRQLLEEDSISLPFLKSEFYNSTVNNESGISYNSLQSYNTVTSLSSLCMVECRGIGANFPMPCKKKSSGRHRLRLEKFLTSFKKGKRSKSFVRRRKCWTNFNFKGSGINNKKTISDVKKICSSKKKIGGKTKELVVYKESGELVTYKQSSLDVNVLLDEETLRVWNLLKDEKGHEENDEMKHKYWEDTRKMFWYRVKSFMRHMHLFQGDRRFLPWKGSVLDSVIGAFLTQNVSDHSSSSAFMTLAAKFPVKATSCEKSNEDLSTPGDQQEPIMNNVIFSGPKFDKEMEDSKHEDLEIPKARESSKVDIKGTKNKSSLTAERVDPASIFPGEKKLVIRKKNMNEEEKEKLKEKKQQYWDTVRKMHTKSFRSNDHMDSVDWEEVRCAEASEVAKAIVSRGQQNMMAVRIQHLLNNLMDSNGSVDLEWLRYAPPKEAKEYLLNIYGLGLKSVECIRLLTLHHIAFPVDVNVGRIAVRLGWVPLQPLPDYIQIHNLEMFPDPNKIQQYLWPRLCTLDQRTLYELHYQLITFGKVFCTKNKPNCDACPMRNECKHFASAMASAKPALPESTSDKEKVVPPLHPANSFEKSTLLRNFGSEFIFEVNNSLNTKVGKECEPIIEFPSSPELESIESNEFEAKNDEEFHKDSVYYDIEDIPTIKLINEESQDYSPEEFEQDMNKSTALVALHADAANIHVHKMKNVSRLKTERLVYVLPDEHPLLAENTPRQPDDPSPYLLVIWTTGELESSCEAFKDNSQEEEHSLTVPGTILIPCRTAMRGRFPLNGTYFQVNEVFADHASMIHPINVPRKWLWNLEKRIVYFGTGISSITRGLSMMQIRDCFWNGFICVRAMDSKTRASRPISSILHRNTTTKLGKGNKSTRVNKE